jgi:hypothetical protein
MAQRVSIDLGQRGAAELAIALCSVALDTPSFLAAADTEVP